MFPILLATCVLMIAELYAITKMISLNKENALKRPFLVSLFPVIYIISINIRNKENNNIAIIEQLRLVLKKDDEKFKESGCYSIIDSIINKDGAIDNKECKIIVGSIDNYYNDMFNQLSKAMNENEKRICILHHLGVKPQIIGDILNISYATVRTHKARIKLKLSETEFDLFFSPDYSAFTTNYVNQNEAVH